MGKRIVCCTSTGCLDYFDSKYDIRSIRIKLEIDGKYYADGSEMPADKFYALLEANKDLIPKTTQTPVGELVDFFNELYDEGYDQVFVCTISAHLSGTINAVDTAAALLEDKMTIVSYDTKSVCFNEGCFALKAAQMVEEGKSFDEIKEALDYMSTHNLIIFAVEHLDFLIKNGRLSNASGFFANLLQIKPLLEVQNDGEIRATKKIRTIQAALTEVANRVKEYTEGHDYWMYIVATTNERVPYLKTQITNVLGVDADKLLLVPCSPVVGCHVGNGALGFGVFLKD
ncbi:MAG: DegV family protein [Coprobacillus sp.]|nr:DegV family protein [Coprobacillus sp.]